MKVKLTLNIADLTFWQINKFDATYCTTVINLYSGHEPDVFVVVAVL